MSAVTFAIGSRPSLSEHDARDLAELLILGRNLVSIRLAGKIRGQADLDPDRPPASVDIELSREELEQLAAVFTDGPDLLAVPAFAHLNAEVLAELG